jgi:immune inhibitor A
MKKVSSAREGSILRFSPTTVGVDLTQAFAELEARVAALESGMASGGNAEPFIGTDLRPDLAGGPDYAAQGDLQERMAAGDRDAKIAFDTLPPA